MSKTTPLQHKPIIVLDRDGVINYDSPDYIKSVDEWNPIPGSILAIARLSQAGYRVFVATNQSGVGRRLFNETTLIAIHNHMQQLVAHENGCIEKIVYCPHTPTDHCQCRKPKPGLLQQIMTYAKCQADDLLIIGDSLRDLQAAVAAGCQQMGLVKTGNGEKTLHEHQHDPIMQRTVVYTDLAAVADLLFLAKKP